MTKREVIDFLNKRLSSEPSYDEPAMFDGAVSAGAVVRGVPLSEPSKPKTRGEEIAEWLVMWEENPLGGDDWLVFNSDRQEDRTSFRVSIGEDAAKSVREIIAPATDRAIEDAQTEAAIREREACARAAEAAKEGWLMAGRAIARAIRARSSTASNLETKG